MAKLPATNHLAQFVRDIVQKDRQEFFPAHVNSASLMLSKTSVLKTVLTGRALNREAFDCMSVNFVGVFVLQYELIMQKECENQANELESKAVLLTNNAATATVTEITSHYVWHILISHSSDGSTGSSQNSGPYVTTWCLRKSLQLI
ncbi:hypothetical protein J6590_080830 [Homalodisca vitripennis]|nr:hypothetical protein J6590_080830 [Homalodisca vitripennis]